VELTNEQQQNFNSIYSSGIPNISQTTIPPSFGGFQGSSLVQFPNDTVQLDIYNDQDFYYETITAARNYSINGNEVYVDLEKELTEAGYDAGDFKVNIRFLRNYLGSASTIKLLVQEISPDRQEIRVIPARLAGNPDSGSQSAANQANIAFAEEFANGFFSYNKAQVLSSLYVFADPLTAVEVTDYVQDTFTINTSPYSIIFKLNEALPSSVRVNSSVWISQETNPATVETVVLVPQIKRQNLVRIKSANFDVNSKRILGTNTEYKAWDDVLASNKTNVVRSLLSGSLVEGTQLNVDYTNFENFVKFSNAYERIKNFEYKVKLIENYQSVSSSLATSTSSGSIYIQTQMSGTLGKIDAIIGAFDGFERYMYFESSSYVSNSFGEFVDMAWPKSTSTKPYTLYGSNTTQVENWLTGLLESASIYDNINPYSLQKLVPQHIQEQDSDIVNSFIDMLGHFFDIQYEYISQFTTRFDRQEKITDGFAKELIYNIAQNLGVDFSNGLNFQDLWSYTLGLDSSGSYDNTLKLSGQDRTRELWKRIINNLPYLLKTKGTERGIRALINCFGIPSTILRIKEFSGPEIDFDKTSTYNHDRFYYGLNVGAGSTTTSGSYLVAPWSASRANQTPIGVQIRFKAAPFSGSVTRYNLMSWYTASIGPEWDPAGTFTNAYGSTLSNPYGALDIGRDSGGDFIEYVPNGGNSDMVLTGSNALKLYIPSSSNTSTLFDGDWITLYLRETGSWSSPILSSSFELFAGKKSAYSETPLIYSASILYTGSISDTLGSIGYRASRAGIYWSGYADSPNGFKWLVIGSSSKAASFTQTTASFSGSIQELRFWGQQTTLNVPNTSSGSVLAQSAGLNLDQSPFYAHIISPTTIVGQNYENQNWTGATSSYNDLNFRLNLGTNNVKSNLDTTWTGSSYTTFIVTSSVYDDSNFKLYFSNPLLTSSGFPVAAFLTASMSTSVNIANYPTGYNLYFIERNNGSASPYAKLVLDMLDAGYSVITTGNDTSTSAGTSGSGGTGWPILEAAAAATPNRSNWSGSKATGAYGVPSNHPIGFGWTNWADGDGDTGTWINKLATRPGPDTYVYPLAVSGSTQLTTTPETNTTAKMVAFYAVNTKSGGRWVHTQNRDYRALSASAGNVGVIPKQITNFLMKTPKMAYVSGSEPNQSSNWNAPAALVGYNSSTGSYWTSVVETNYTPWPDLIGNRQTSNKIRIEDTINTSDQLFRNHKTQKSLQDTQPPDSPRLGIYLSPTDELNQDIAEQFGGISVDDYIGDYSNVYENEYKDLKGLQREYAKKSVGKFNTQGYVRLLQHFNGSLFSLVKQMVPYRANLQTGLVVEPHILDRSKVRAVNRPTVEDAYYESLIDSTMSATMSGDLSNLTSSIDMPQADISALSFTQHEGSVNAGTILTLTGKQNEYNNTQVPAQGVDIGVNSLESDVDLNTTSYGRSKNLGSQYRFPTWFSTGSGTYTGFISNSAGFIYTDSTPRSSWEATGVTILDNRKSEIVLVAGANESYNGTDIYNGTGSITPDVTSNFNINIDYTLNVNRTSGSIPAKLGLRAYSVSASGEIGSIGNTSTNHLFRIDVSDYLYYRIGLSGATNIRSTGSVWLTAFPTKSNSIDYSTVSFNYRGNDTANAATMSVWLGSSGSTSTPNFTASFSTATNNTYNQTIIGTPTNSDLYIETRVSSSNNTGGIIFDNFVVKHYKYAQMQDYHVGPLASIGLRNQKYDGCKLTSNGYNEDSPDTIDKGPVITVIDGPAVDLKVNPNAKGTYTFR
jgi:hypothetical protein